MNCLKCPNYWETCPNEKMCEKCVELQQKGEKKDG